MERVGFDIPTVAALLSLGLCTVFVTVVIYSGRQSTMLMKCVVCMCISDALICFWELVACVSSISNSGLCLQSISCNVHMPILRTLQTTEALWCAMVAVGIFMTVSGRKIGYFRYMHVVWPLALLIEAPAFIAAMCGAYVNAADDGWCLVQFPVFPDIFLLFAHITTLCVIVGTYIRSVFIVFRLSNHRVFLRTVNRAISYVAIYVFCLLPYVVSNVFWGTLPKTVFFDMVLNRVLYFFYFMTGSFHVIAYGINHWDSACWSRHARGEHHEARIVTFATALESGIATSTRTTSRTSTLSTLTPSEHEEQLLVRVLRWDQI
eukprot:TRINITY_DN13715_c0_g1_i2.p1 TRINITY_DN13715_c0_g1~~TRINITY_DN13715_c0_g1_i2.p1  ORF type:complete len:376 (-),score=7.83 TRINITY_DN13715_c0_g1_i2:274-1233(-)